MNQKTYTHKLIFKGYDVDDVLIDEATANGLKKARRETPTATFDLRGSNHNVADIKHIIQLDAPRAPRSMRTCANIGCDYGKHESGAHCPLDVVASCEDCGKELRWRDVEYMRYKKYRTICRNCLYGAPPAAERFDMNDEKQRARAMETIKAEGAAFHQREKEMRPLCEAGTKHDYNQHDKCIWCGKALKQEELV